MQSPANCASQQQMLICILQIGFLRRPWLQKAKLPDIHEGHNQTNVTLPAFKAEAMSSDVHAACPEA